LIDSTYETGGDMIADPYDDDVFWRCGSYFNGAVAVMCVSKSTDCGMTWTLSELTDTYGTTNTIALDPQNSNIVYAGGYEGVFKTTDNGTTWTFMSDTVLMDVVDIEVHPTNTDTVLAVTRFGVYKSIDAGSTWEHIGSSLVNAVVIDHMNPDQVYIATDSGVYLGTYDGGWTIMSEGLDDSLITSIAINPDNYLFCGTDASAVFRWDIGTGIEEYTASSLSGIQVFPNPTNRQTTVTYHIAFESDVSLSVYDVQGRLIRMLHRGRQTAGSHSVLWNGRDAHGKIVTPGVYFCKVSTDRGAWTEKLVLLH
jgi:hypothetical protein